MVLKDVQCPETGCGGMVQFTIDSDEEIVNVKTPLRGQEQCPECGTVIGIDTR